MNIIKSILFFIGVYLLIKVIEYILKGFDVVESIQNAISNVVWFFKVLLWIPFNLLSFIPIFMSFLLARLKSPFDWKQGFQDYITFSNKLFESINGKQSTGNGFNYKL